MVYRDLSIFSGTAHPELAQAVCRYLGVPLGKAEVVKFSNENIFTRSDLDDTVSFHFGFTSCTQ